MARPTQCTCDPARKALQTASERAKKSAIRVQPIQRQLAWLQKKHRPSLELVLLCSTERAPNFEAAWIATLSLQPTLATIILLVNTTASLNRFERCFIGMRRHQWIQAILPSRCSSLSLPAHTGCTEAVFPVLHATCKAAARAQRRNEKKRHKPALIQSLAPLRLFIGLPAPKPQPMKSFRQRQVWASSF